MVNDTDAQLLNLKNNILSYDSEALTHVCKLILHKHANSGFHPSLRTRWTRWTSGSFKNGEE